MKELARALFHTLRPNSLRLLNQQQAMMYGYNSSYYISNVLELLIK